MSDRVLPGTPPIALHLRRSAQARRVSLRISQLDGRVTLTLPRGLPEREALAFAREKEPWIRRHLAARADEVRVRFGVQVPVGGVPHAVEPGPGRSLRLAERRILVPGPEERVGARVAGHLKALAKLRFAEAARRHAGALGRPFSAISLRDTRSRWGSCTAEGRLMFSWRLVMAPPEVLDYVAAHEVAHLAELNHGPAFWAHVKALYGDHTAARRWLRRDGADLHRFRFE